MIIRPEHPEDAAAVRRVNEHAFGRPAEADLVHALHSSGAVSVSLVAVDGDDVVGHILFSPVEVVSASGVRPAIALGPMAVLPTRQREGIGSALVRRGLDACRDQGHDLVFVLGHSKYYPRFGFGQTRGARCEFDCPPEVFMVVTLSGDPAPTFADAVVTYRPEFKSV